MAKEKATQIVQLYERKTQNGTTYYLHYSINGEQIRENTHLRLTGNKDNDKVVKKAAQMLQANKTAELLSNKTGIATESSRNKILLTDYCKKIYERTADGTKKSQSYHSITKRIIGIINSIDSQMNLCNISKDFCAKFIDKLNKEKLAESSKNRYYAQLSIVLNQAIKEDLISINPFTKIENKPQRRSADKVYLLENEIKAFAEIAPKNKRQSEIKDAFLFSVFSGFRYSDISRITKDNIEQTNEGFRIKIETQKTKKFLSFLLPPQCETIILNHINSGKELLFDLPSITHIERVLKMFAKKANIEKNISFHTARHTFATLLLTKGADLYTVSTLLGHSNITTTQIYAKIIDKKKDEAIKLLNNIL